MSNKNVTPRVYFSSEGAQREFSEDQLMQCESPPPLSEMDLDLALGGDVLPRIREHLRRCPACRERLARHAAEEIPVRARLFRAECPSSEHLGEWQMGLLEPAQAAAIAAHLALCPWCQHDANLIAEVLAQPLTATESLFAGLRRLVAHLAETGRPGPTGRLALALRGGGGNVRAYEAGDLQVTLAAEPLGSGRMLLVGLLTRTNAALGGFAGTPVQLLQHDQIVAETTIDELDNFTFDNIPRGEYSLAVPLEQDVLLVPGLDLLNE